MTQEVLSHSEIVKRFCPIINYSCKGAYCLSFKAEEVSVRSKNPNNFGDWIPLEHAER